MKKMLVVVDMQKDFVDGSLGSKQAQLIVPAAAEKIRRKAIAKSVPIKRLITS